MAEALRILGYKDVYHGVDTLTRPEDLHVFNRAADASFPCLPSYTGGPPLTQEEWEDALYGPCEAATDIAGVFGELMVRAYPEARVVLPVREYEGWARSIDDTILGVLWSPAASLVSAVFAPLAGSVGLVAMRKVMLGLLRARSVGEARDNLRATYDRHHDEVRAAVRPGLLLEHRFGDDWEPLCQFLGKPVPDVEFPWVNEAAVLKAKIRASMLRTAMGAARVAAPWAVGAAVLGFWLWAVRYA